MAKPLITCIITAWKEDPPEKMIKQMLAQTYPKKQILVICSDIDLDPLKEKYPNCEFFDVPNRKDWAHTKRATGICFAEGKYLCFCNADDKYDPNFLDLMIAGLEKFKADLVVCDWYDKTISYGRVDATMALGGMTSGNFVVKSDLAKYVGWKYRVYAADWYFLRDVLKAGAKSIKISEPLMTHN